MVIARIIQPLVWQPYLNQNTGGEHGLGDMVPTFFSVAKEGGQGDLGRWTSVHNSNGDQHDFGTRKVKHGSFSGGPGAAG